MASTFSQSSSLKRINRPSMEIPALLTNTSMRLCSAMIDFYGGGDRLFIADIKAQRLPRPAGRLHRS